MLRLTVTLQEVNQHIQIIKLLHFSKNLLKHIKINHSWLSIHLEHIIKSSKFNLNRKMHIHDYL